ncbi:alpha/beta hydrolase [Candidatus Woesearchaeota archaeon]|nr:alpha/beta hydrolase [Candidatus Woesearchaeota archaeon]
MMVFRSLIINFLIPLIIIYFLFGIFLFLNQKSMIYYPNNQDFEKCSGFLDYQKKNHNGTRFYYKHGSADKVIIYYHGNAGSACDRSYFRPTFEQSNSSLIFVEYAGYSNDDKKPSRKLILKDVQNMHDYVKKNSYNDVLIYGHSIGTGAASYHAYLGNVNSLILVSPFSTLDEVAQSIYRIYPASIMLREKYDNIKWLKDYNGNIIILHGENDQIIPKRFSRRLFDGIPNKNKEYVLIEGKGHNDIWSSSIFKNKIIEYINGARN